MHYVSEFNGVPQKLEVVFLWIEKFQSILCYRSQIILENVVLKDLCILLVSFVLTWCHISDNKKELNHHLECTVEVFVSHFVICFLLHFDFGEKLAGQEFQIVKLKWGTYAADINLERYFWNNKLLLWAFFDIKEILVLCLFLLCFF